MKSEIPDPSPALTRLNSLPAPEATSVLLTACASRPWAAQLTSKRPFPTLDALLAESDQIWFSLSRADCLEAFSHHPRIGERTLAPTSQTAKEQSGMAAATPQQRADFITGNKQYEQRFGHIFLICATGKSAAEMLAALHTRLTNDPETELATAAREQAMITRLRLTKLLST